MSAVRPRHRALRTANAVGAVVSAGFAVAGVVRPEFVHPSSAVTPVARFWAVSSAVRGAVITGAVLHAVAGRDRPRTRTALGVAGLVQAADSALGVWQRKPGMTVGPAVLAVIHLLGAHWLPCRDRRRQHG